MPSCLRVNVNQRDKPSEAEMGLTADDPSVLCYHSVADTPCVEPQAAGGNVWKYSKEHRGHHVGAGKEMMLTQAISSSCSPPTHRAGKSGETTMKVRMQEIMNRCEAQSTLKFSVPRKERARMGFGVLLLKRSCRQTLSRRCRAAPRVPPRCPHLREGTAATADRRLRLSWQRVPELIYSTCSAFSEQQMRCLIIHGRCIIAGN